MVIQVIDAFRYRYLRQWYPSCFHVINAAANGKEKWIM
jgi:hypothetical protein